MLLPVFVREELGGPGSLGLLLAAYGAGGLVGAAGFGAAAGRVGRRALFLVVWLAYAPLCAVLVMLPPVWVALPTLFAIGVLAGATCSLEQLVRQEHTPPELRARVFATFMASLTAVVPPALLAAGVVVDALGLRVGFAALTVGNAALTALALTVALPRLGAPTRRPARAAARRASSTSRS